MKLLERGSYLNEMENTFSDLSGGNGFVVLISGEAGIGKTSLVESFVELTGQKANVLWGACDALFTPRPLGPLYDIASQLKNGLLDHLNKQTSRTIIFQKFFKELHENKLPNIVIIEDVHWADEATLDLIKFLGRRVARSNSVFIITFRDDELGPDHPLKLVIGDIQSKNLIRYKLQSLSEKTVGELAESYGIKNLFRLTGGNPFLITELLSNKEEGIPSTVKDSILTRILRLSADSREFVELVSVIPTKAEKWLLESLIKINPDVLEECFSAGILRIEEGSISFKHELIRMALEESLGDPKLQQLNEKVLRILIEQKNIDVFLARIIHHASKAQNAEAILKYAPMAAKQASKLGAHIQAAKHYLTALQYSDRVSTEEHLNLLEGRSYECYLTGKIEEGIKAGNAVTDILRNFPDPEREGENYRRLSRMLWYDCQDEKGEEFLNKAVEVLEKVQPGRSLAMAYSNKSQVYMIRENTESAVYWGKKALALSEKNNFEDIKAHTLNNIGTAKLLADDLSGEVELKRSLDLSLQNDFYEHAARAYINLGSVMLQKRKLYEADGYFSEGNEYCSEKDLYTYGLCNAGHHAIVHLYLGNWDKAIDLANSILKREDAPSGNKVMPIFIIGLIRTRRNDPGAMKLLNESDILALNIGEADKIVLVKSAKAEAYWLQNRLGDIADELESVYLKVKNTKNPWNIGPIAFWLWKAKRLKVIPELVSKPFLLQIKGDWESASGLWEKLHCPYEQAMALSDGGEKAMKKAVEIFERLGASASSQLIKRKMRESGMKSIPKGPRKTTKKNPAGLTSRQFEILNLLGKGLSNNEIGNRLYISPKTVDHHISAILAKLNIHSRFEAARFVNSEVTSVK